MIKEDLRPQINLYKLWRLKKCLYGLKDASRQWYLRLKSILKQNGFQKSIYDGGMFFIIKNDTLIGIVGIHVDDFLATGTDECRNTIIPNVLKAFLVGKAESQESLPRQKHIVAPGNQIGFVAKNRFSIVICRFYGIITQGF